MVSLTLKKHKQLIKLSFGVVCLIFILCPIATLPWIINGCYNNKKKYYILASLFMGICALILFLPVGDQYRHAMNYYNLRGQPWIVYYLLSIANGQIDFIVNGILFIANYYDLPFGFVRAFLSTVCAYLFLLLYDDFCNCSIQTNNKYKELIFWVIFFIFPLSSICSGLRFSTSVCIVVYVFVKWNILKKKKITDGLFLLLAVLIHTGIIIAIIVYGVSCIVSMRINKKIFIFLLIVCFFISSSFYLILEYLPLPSLLSDYVQKYTDGKFANSEYITSGSNIIGLIQTYLGLYGNLLTVVIPILINFKYNSGTKYLYALLILYVLTTNMFSLNGRIGIIIIIYGGFALIRFWRKDIRKVLISLVCIAVVMQVFNWKKLKYPNYRYFVYPIVFIADADYGYKWMEENVNEEGTIKDYW